jgi:hypothetical protein
MPVSEREHFETLLKIRDLRIDSLDRLWTELREADKEALRIALVALNGRLESMNEFRLQLTEERATYVRKDELNIRLDVIESNFKPTQDASMKLTAQIGALIGLVSLASGLIGAAATMFWK